MLTFQPRVVVCLVAGVLFLAAIVCPAFATDPTTDQTWGFPDATLTPIPPDPGFDNGNGDPVGTAPGTATWHAAFQGRAGVWEMPAGTQIFLSIPNCPIPDRVKNLDIEVIYRGTQPNIVVADAGACDIEVAAPVALENDWMRLNATATCASCPSFETVQVGATTEPLHIDSIRVQTECVVLVPTFSKWGLLLTATVMFILGLVFIRGLARGVMPS